MVAEMHFGFGAAFDLSVKRGLSLISAAFSVTAPLFNTDNDDWN